MSKANSSRAPETNQEAIDQFHKAFRGRRIDVGEVLLLPDVGQMYEVVGHKFWKKKGASRFNVSLVFETECVVCDKKFELAVHRHFKGVARTCPEHRGLWKNPKRAAKPRAAVLPRSAPNRDAVCGVLEAYALVYDRVHIDTVVVAARDVLPRNPGERDTRRQSVRRAISRMVGAGELPCRLDGDYFVF